MTVSTFRRNRWIPGVQVLSVGAAVALQAIVARAAPDPAASSRPPLPGAHPPSAHKPAAKPKPGKVPIARSKAKPGSRSKPPASKRAKPNGKTANGKRSSRSHKRPAAPAFPADAEGSKAWGYARLDPDECTAELERRQIRFHKEAAAPGVKIPVRLEGPMDGVLYRTDYPDPQRATVPYEVFDCRLVLSLSDLSAVLRTHDIDEVRIFSAWRPPPKSWPAGKLADRHPGGLAADLRLFRKSSGDALDVEKDFHGKLGASPCGTGAVPPSPETPGAVELRSILCAAAEERLFHVLLSPNCDYDHRNHFHVEVRPDVRWFIVR
jgi:hypothetical protein